MIFKVGVAKWNFGKVSPILKLNLQKRWQKQWSVQINRACNCKYGNQGSEPSKAVICKDQQNMHLQLRWLKFTCKHIERQSHADTSQVINICWEDCWMHRLWLKQPKLHLSYINNSDREDNVLWFVFWWSQMKFLFENCWWVFPQVYASCGSGVRDLFFGLVAFELICA